MRVKPILFRAPMVLGLLREVERPGTGKTKTRRIINLSRYDLEGYSTSGQIVHYRGDHRQGIQFVSDKYGLWHERDNPAGRSSRVVPLPYAVGDLLWVRETWAQHHPAGVQADRFSIEGQAGIPGPPGVKYRVIYRADGDPLRVWYCEDFPYRTVEGPRDDIDARHPDVCSEMPGWTSPIFMPRWASRLTLEVTDVRAERLQDINEADVRAEGLSTVTKDGRLWKWGMPDRDGLPGTDNHGWPWTDWEKDPRQAFRKLWNSINGAGAWEANPWVAAYSFQVHHRNVGQLLAERREAV